MCWRSRHIWRELPPEATREELLRVVPASITIKPRLVAVGVVHPKAVSRRVAFNEESSGARSWCASTMEWECCYNHVPVLLQKRIPMSVTQPANLIPRNCKRRVAPLLRLVCGTLPSAGHHKIVEDG